MIQKANKKKTNATDVKSTEKSFKKYESSTTMPELSTNKSKSFDTNSSLKNSVGNKDSKTFIIIKKGSSVKTNPESSTAELMSRQKYSEGDTIRSIFKFRNSVDAAINKGVWANTYKSSESEIEEEILKDAEALIHPANKVKIYAREPKWFCHFDDRTYVNVNQLVNVLQRFNYLDEWYLGKKHRNVSLSKLPSRRKKYRVKKIFYSSNTAGFCLSLGMIHKIKHYIRGDRFNQFCAAYDLKDDAALGFIIIHLLKIELFNLPEFHSRKEHIKFKPMQSFRDQVSFSFKEANTFQSLHCFLYPRSQYCKTPQMLQTLKDMFTGDHFTDDDDDDDGDKYDDDEEDDDD
ncbi:hypothetical protein JYU34_007248 [Plutella xylostella]|uniref:Fringe-like glycosyltransferase domain-containing protein n=1 Tax=Plutella xylostella TaxID=51655 RepID=A0ABQ7QPY7_PLUXY|nr:hypothetical protein JYU34_007248 [Plutella xylostella]